MGVERYPYSNSNFWKFQESDKQIGAIFEGLMGTNPTVGSDKKKVYSASSGNEATTVYAVDCYTSFIESIRFVTHKIVLFFVDTFELGSTECSKKRTWNLLASRTFFWKL